MGIHKLNTTAYHPQCDGLVEGFNKTLKRMLGILASRNQTDWDVYVPYAMFAYRTAVHTSTGYTPFELLFGQEARLPLMYALFLIPSLVNLMKITVLSW